LGEGGRVKEVTYRVMVVVERDFCFCKSSTIVSRESWFGGVVTEEEKGEEEEEEECLLGGDMGTGTTLAKHVDFLERVRSLVEPTSAAFNVGEMERGNLLSVGSVCVLGETL